MLASPGMPETRFGVRCFLGNDLAEDSRFGVDLLDPATRALIDTVDAGGTFRLAGLHCHHSGQRSPRGLLARANRLIEYHFSVLEGRDLEFIDIGGGVFSPAEPDLAKQLGAVPSDLAEYGGLVGGRFAEVYGLDGPTIILEPGMGILADTMEFVAPVEVVKELAGQRYAVLGGSVLNINPLRSGVRLPVGIVPKPDSRIPAVAVWKLVGRSCMEIDVMRDAFEGAIAPGDYVVFSNVGAYSNVMDPAFINGTPAIVSVAPDGSFDVLRRQSTVEDLLSTYLV